MFLQCTDDGITDHVVQRDVMGISLFLQGLHLLPGLLQPADIGSHMMGKLGGILK